MRGVYYTRTVDPDQGQPHGLSYSTLNWVEAQRYDSSLDDDDDSRASLTHPNLCLVASAIEDHPGMYGGLASINSHCRVYHSVNTGRHESDPTIPFDTSNQDHSAWRTFTKEDPQDNDSTINLGFHYPIIDPGASVTFKFAYVLSPDDVEKALVSLASLAITAPSSVATGTSVLFQTTLDISQTDCGATPDACIIKTVKFEIFTVAEGGYKTLDTMSGTPSQFTYFTLFDSTEFIADAADTLATMQVTVTMEDGSTHKSTSGTTISPLQVIPDIVHSIPYFTPNTTLSFLGADRPLLGPQRGLSVRRPPFRLRLPHRRRERRVCR